MSNFQESQENVCEIPRKLKYLSNFQMIFEFLLKMVRQALCFKESQIVNRPVIVDRRKISEIVIVIKFVSSIAYKFNARQQFRFIRSTHLIIPRTPRIFSKAVQQTNAWRIDSIW